jgi:hypothetical protein
MSLNSAARLGVFQTRCSRSVKTAWRGRIDGTGKEALLVAGTERIRSHGQMRRSI